MVKFLQISDDFRLPYDAVTETFAILAKRGVGKTYLASVIVEEMVKAGLPVVIIDPTGAWWGLRSSLDGKSAGLPVIILGGEHGDLPLTVDMAEAIALFLAENATSMILDLSLFSKGDRARFMAPFAEKLYLANRNALHLVLDEADRFAPQKPMPDQNRMLGAIDEIVRMGRVRGLGVTMITQRPAVLNKDVLTQIEVLVALRTIGPQDRKAIDAWIDENGTPEQRSELMKSLPSLPVGTAWFWSPGWLDVFNKVQVRKRETFNSSATPKVGEKRVIPDVRAEVDLDAITSALESYMQAADSVDPTKLQRKIAELQKQLAAKPAAESVRVEVPVIGEAQMGELRSMANAVIEQAERLISFGESIATLIEKAQKPVLPVPEIRRLTPVQTVNRGMPQQKPIISPSPSAPKYIQPEGDDMPDVSDLALGSSSLKIARALAQRYPTRFTRPQIGTISGYVSTSGSFRNSLSKLRTAGFLDEAPEGITLTAACMEFLGEIVPMPQGPDELIAMWRNALPGTPAKMFDVLVNHYPHELSRADLGEAVGNSSSSGSFRNYLSILRTNGLIMEKQGYVRASDHLYIDKAFA